MTIGEALRKVRDSRKVSRRKLAEDLKISTETIKRIELNQIKDPRVITLQRMFRYFGYQLVLAVTTDDFLDEEDSNISFR